MNKKRCRHCWHHANGTCLDPEEKRPPRCSRRMRCDNFLKKPLVLVVVEGFERILTPWF
jgi:hypothetical protein